MIDFQRFDYLTELTEDDQGDCGIYIHVVSHSSSHSPCPRIVSILDCTQAAIKMLTARLNTVNNVKAAFGPISRRPAVVTTVSGSVAQIFRSYASTGITVSLLAYRNAQGLRS